MDYFVDPLGTITSYEPLSQIGKVGGTDHNNRQSQNPFRGNVITEQHALATGDLAFKNKPTLIDYGCGKGEFVKYMKTRLDTVAGYDPFAQEFSNIPGFKADVVSMVEVIEHTFHPYDELDEVRDMLKPNGLLFVETSFSDWVTVGHPYIDPEIGHSTIFSHKGMDATMADKGFELYSIINRNIRIYRKF